MEVVTKEQFIKLMEHYPNGGIVFAEYEPDIFKSEVMVTNGDFGATNVTPWHGEVFDWDWNIGEYSDRDTFVVFDNRDVLQMIQTLTRGLRINLADDY